jgi:putative DNA primase/helicase
VPINLVRRKADEVIEPFRFDRVDHLAVLARKLMRWTKDNADAIPATEPPMPAGLYNRTADNWRPLMAIAMVAGGDWLARGHKAALQCAGADVDEGSRLELLLGDIRSIAAVLNVTEITSNDLITRLCEIVPRPWTEISRGKPMTQNKLARLLKPLGITSDLIGEKRLAGYRLEHFKEAFERYLAPQGNSNLSSSHNPYDTGVSDLFATSHPGNAREVGKLQKSNNDGVKRGGEVGKGGSGGQGLPEREVDEVAEWVQAFAARHVGEPDIDALITQALRERLRNKYNVRPEDLDIEAERIMARAFGPLK